MNTAVADIEADRHALTQRAARQQREARIRFWRVFSVSSFFIVVLGANIYLGAVVMIAKYGNPFVVGKAPASSTALIKRPLLDGVFCRNMVFDNATSHALEEKVERCEKPVERQVRPKTQFNWGGR
jgi:hypothetical protein